MRMNIGTTGAGGSRQTRLRLFTLKRYNIFFASVLVATVPHVLRAMALVLMHLGWQHRPGRVALVIGANDGTDGNNAVVNSWLSLCNTSCHRLHLSVVLVEPNPAVFDNLRRTVQTDYNDSPCILPVNALISSSSQHMSFFKVNVSRLRTVCARPPHWATFQLSSVDRTATETQLLKFLKWATRRSGMAFRCDADAGAIGDYIIEERLPSTTVHELLSRTRLRPSDVDVLAIDTQGHDAEIIKSAFSDAEFFPRIITFEYTMLGTRDLEDVLQILEHRGYATSCHRTVHAKGGETTHDCKVESRGRKDQDVYATHTLRGLYLGVPES